MSTNPLIQFPSGENAEALHILITSPGAIIGTEAQREEIARGLPKPAAGKHWEYQSMSMYPLRFATIHDADAFLESLAAKQVTDRYFIQPMLYNETTKKWHGNKAYNEAHGELVVFVQKEDAPYKKKPRFVVCKKCNSEAVIRKGTEEILCLNADCHPSFHEQKSPVEIEELDMDAPAALPPTEPTP